MASWFILFLVGYCLAAETPQKLAATAHPSGAVESADTCNRFQNSLYRQGSESFALPAPAAEPGVNEHVVDIGSPRKKLSFSGAGNWWGRSQADRKSTMSEMTENNIQMAALESTPLIPHTHKANKAEGGLPTSSALAEHLEQEPPQLEAKESHISECHKGVIVAFSLVVAAFGTAAVKFLIDHIGIPTI
ncbi:hypothetical protein PTTG_26329 [Puccinia triticina 1-1 BBBD Race 1]|uniref:Uncharacterized protein n=2 Tax=Puccinia triticina TaxID=208348 RepID=A0A180GW16_PUCT1|nr:uncharacterized protein PtA15_3A745 [Puccinia triticina]OAV96538.1 hypothetical protein PTTG_26329 [Puccinia triticina 1-1 BBBD Race 1]WAQ83375.1 hypothetical protein PtA15_3A745 [Puccinia triticina]WAR54221.1 hypothetical protein PtB15_3B735 [Puccinia triticina]